MKLSKKKPLKVYLCKDENMKEGDVLMQFDKPFNYCFAQALWNRSLDKFELTFEKQLLGTLRTIKISTQVDETQLLTIRPF